MQSNELSGESFFDVADYYFAKTAFDKWQVDSSKEFEDFLIRQRKQELYALVKRVIENELSQSDKVLIDLKWNKMLKNVQIAKMLGVDSSTVSRRLEKITDILYQKLKYAVEFRFSQNQTPAILIRTAAKSKKENAAQGSVSSRLRALRKESLTTISELSHFSGLSIQRIEEIESGKELKTNELELLCEFFKVSSDYILFGKMRTLRDPLTGMPIKCRC